MKCYYEEKECGGMCPHLRITYNRVKKKKECSCTRMFSKEAGQ